MWFFTVNLVERQNNGLLIDNIDLLRQSFRTVKKIHPFSLDAIVVLPEHLHCIWSLPEGDSDYSTRWNLIKGNFSRSINKGEKISISRINRRERGIWQRRFWEHMIRDEADYINHLDYIHWNPVKHGHVKKVVDWPYSSFHKYVENDKYPVNWGHNGKFELDTGEQK
jgi:putative transposase